MSINDITDEQRVDESCGVAAFSGVPVTVAVQLPSTWLPAVAVNSLKVGEVLQTGIAADTAPVLTIAGRAALRVRSTTRRRRVACTVVGPVSDTKSGSLR